MLYSWFVLTAIVVRMAVERSDCAIERVLTNPKCRIMFMSRNFTIVPLSLVLVGYEHDYEKWIGR